jgi:haloalkane dehalogenase
MKIISEKYPFESHYAPIKGHKIHYIEEGKGSPILFLHGVPTWSYLWRNIIPGLSSSGRCIAPDLIGFGLSDKPEIDYTIFDHIDYIEAFIERLHLENITLVMHGWGSVIGFHYAMRHPENVKGLVFMEGHIRPVIERDMVALPVQERSSILHHEAGKDIIINSNYYVNKSIPMGTMRKLSKDELAYYQKPFEEPGAGKPIWQFLQDLPTSNKKTPVVELIEVYSKKLQTSDIPKLMLYGFPGFNTTIETVAWAREHFNQLTVVEIEDTLHYIPESQPDEVSKTIRDWLLQITD